MVIAQRACASTCDMRLAIPKRTEAEILFLNRHTCCICHEKNKDVQVHHIDSNASNNSSTNLAVLCLDCHSRVTGLRGLGRRFSPFEVRRYKKEWEYLNRRFAIALMPKYRKIPKLEKELFTFEIKRTVYEIMATKDSDRDSIDRAFQFLQMVAILESLHKVLIDQLHFALALSAAYQINIPIALAGALPRFFAYFVDPAHVKMRPAEEKTILDAIDTVRFMHELCTERNKRPNLLRAFISGVAEFIDMGISYKRQRVFREALSILKDIQGSCGKVLYEGDKCLPGVSREIRSLLADVVKAVRKAKLNWDV